MRSYHREHRLSGGDHGKIFDRAPAPRLIVRPYHAFQRVIEIDTKALGAEHPYVADDLEELAQLRREMGMDAAAAELEARVKAIRGE